MIALVRRLPVLPTIVVLVAVGIMIRLGFWQLDRMEVKEALVASYKAALVDDEVITDPAIWEGWPESWAYKRVSFHCDRAFNWRATAGRNAEEVVGYSQMYRCEPDLAFGGDVAGRMFVSDVLIGWSQSPDQVDWVGGRVTGVMVPGGDLGFRVVADPPLAGLEANAKPDPRDIPNNHFAYAVQWFLFALVALVIYALAVRKRLRGG